jgi:hypothetical protein
VRLQHEVDDIQSHRRAFLNNPDQYSKLGQRGLTTLREQHDPEQYVHTILDLASHGQQFRVRKSAYDLARRTGTIMGSLANSSREPIRIAEKIYEICGP